jgi:hypothetical protein
MDETAQFEILKAGSNITNLINTLKKDNYKYIELNNKKTINSFLFLSNFINNLSNL